MSPNLTSFASFYPYIYMCGSGSVFRIPKLLNTYPYWNCIQEDLDPYWNMDPDPHIQYKYRDKNGQKMSD